MNKLILIFNHKAIFISILSTITTYYCIQYKILADFPLTLIATAIVFPVVFSINGAYKRRELALKDYGDLKSHGKAIYFATRDWVDNPSQDTINKCKDLLETLLLNCKKLFSNPIEELRVNEEAVYFTFSKFWKKNCLSTRFFKKRDFVLGA